MPSSVSLPAPLNRCICYKKRVAPTPARSSWPDTFRPPVEGPLNRHARACRGHQLWQAIATDAHDGNRLHRGGPGSGLCSVDIRPAGTVSMQCPCIPYAVRRMCAADPENVPERGPKPFWKGRQPDAAQHALEQLAERLHWKLEHLDPRGEPDWPDLTDHRRDIFRTAVASLLDEYRLVDIALGRRISPR